MGISDTLSDKVKSVARQQRYGGTGDAAALPTYTTNNASSITNQSGGLDQNGRGSPHRPSARDGDRGAGVGGSNSEAHTGNSTQAASSNTGLPAATMEKSEAAPSGDSSLERSEGVDGALDPKPPMIERMTAGSKRFVRHTKSALCHSWINVLLVFVPIGIAAEVAHLSPTIIFAMNAVAIVPLAGLLAHATESVAARLGDTIGALLNVTFGNAVELIIFIIALVKNEIRIVQASLLGSILANLLLILGMAFLLGGLRFREQIYNSTVTQMSACLLSLSVMSLLLPTAFHASFNDDSTALADSAVLAVSRGTSVILLLVYGLYLLFQLKTHAYMYESTPQAIIDEESHPGVLADLLDSSSSDDTSSSSSSDSDSSGSVRTAGKRFKRMIKNRRRRKSSGSTISTPSIPSVLSSPSTQERQGSYWDQATGSPDHSRRDINLSLPTDADAEDADVEAGSTNAPRVRDFGSEATEHNGNEHVSKKSRKKAKKQHKKRHHRHEDDAAVLNEKSATEEQIAPVQSGPRVGFSEDVENITATSTADPAQSRRPFNMRGLSTRAPAIRPGLSKMLSNTVFVTPPPAPPLSCTPTARTRSSGIRRTSSLPDRLNRQNTPSSNTNQTATTRHGPLPPFQHQAIRRARSEDDDATSVDEADEPIMSRTAAVVMLLVSTGLVAICAEFMVEAIPAMIKDSPTVSEAFIGLIILPIVGNAAEHVTAVTVAAKNKMDLAIGVAVGSSIQIALFVTPVVVLLGWILKTEMSLYFNLFETISLFVTAFVVNFLVLDGRSNYLEGSLLIAAYTIIALVAFYYPDESAQSAIGGGVSRRS